MEAGGIGMCQSSDRTQRRMWFYWNSRNPIATTSKLAAVVIHQREVIMMTSSRRRGDRGVEEYFAIFRCKQQSNPISYTYAVAALLRFAQSFANDFNIILTIGTTRRSRGVEWGIVTLRNKAYDRPWTACHRPTKDILLGNILVIPVFYENLQSSNIQGNYSSLHSLRSFQSS